MLSESRHDIIYRGVYNQRTRRVSVMMAVDEQ